MTGIPSEYNGKYVMAYSPMDMIVGYLSMDSKSPDFLKLPQISKGSVSCPLSRNPGNDDLWFMVVIYDTDKPSDESLLVSIGFSSVTFKNGSAKVAWKDKDGSAVDKNGKPVNK